MGDVCDDYKATLDYMMQHADTSNYIRIQSSHCKGGSQDNLVDLLMNICGSLFIFFFGFTIRFLNVDACTKILYIKLLIL